MSCAQIEVTGGGNTKPATVNFPGAYTGKSQVENTNAFELTPSFGS